MALLEVNATFSFGSKLLISTWHQSLQQKLQTLRKTIKKDSETVLNTFLSFCNKSKAIS